jgi:hypothetical protein
MAGPIRDDIDEQPAMVVTPGGVPTLRTPIAGADAVLMPGDRR